MGFSQSVLLKTGPLSGRCIPGKRAPLSIRSSPETASPTKSRRPLTAENPSAKQLHSLPNRLDPCRTSLLLSKSLNLLPQLYRFLELPRCRQHYSPCSLRGISRSEICFDLSSAGRFSLFLGFRCFSLLVDSAVSRCDWLAVFLSWFPPELFKEYNLCADTWFPPEDYTICNAPQNWMVAAERKYPELPPSSACALPSLLLSQGLLCYRSSR